MPNRVIDSLPVLVTSSLMRRKPVDGSDLYWARMLPQEYFWVSSFLPSSNCSLVLLNSLPTTGAWSSCMSCISTVGELRTLVPLS